MSKTIENLKKLKSFHNGSYGADIDEAIKAIEQQPSEDCISRQAAQNKIKEICSKYRLSYEDGERKPATGGSAYALGHAFDDLPPVTPQSKTGQWVNGEYCSECGCDVPTFIIDWRRQEEKDMVAKYCPNCGIKMKGKSEEA